MIDVDWPTLTNLLSSKGWQFALEKTYTYKEKRPNSFLRLCSSRLAKLVAELLECMTQSLEMESFQG